MRITKLLCIVSIGLFITASYALAQQKNQVQLVHEYTYSFEKGYYNSFIEVKGDTVGLICPNLQTIYLVNSKNKEIDTIKFKNGRGPGEITRGPFGIDFSDNKIYLADTDAQRFSMYSFNKKTFQTVIYKSGSPLYGIYNWDGPNMLAEPTGTQQLAYFIYNPAKKEVITEFKFPAKITDRYRYSGLPTVTRRYIVHANRYYGDLVIWNKQTSELIRSSIVKSVSKPESQKAKLGKFSGSIPPRDPELEILVLTGNSRTNNRVFLLMESKDGQYKTNYVYDYDFMEDKVVDKFKIPAEATLLASNKDHLFVYSEEKDEMYQYKLEVK